MGETSLNGENWSHLPYLLFADAKGNIYDHPDLRMAGLSAAAPRPLADSDLIEMPHYSKLFYIPSCPPVGLDPATGDYVVLKETRIEGFRGRCFAVAAFLEPGYVRTHLPAADYAGKDYVLPTWAYTAVGYRDDRYWTAALIRLLKVSSFPARPDI